MDAILRDIRFALRVLRRRRAFTIVAIATLALAIGATTAMFTVVDGVLLRALPYRDPGRLVTVWQTFPHWRGQPSLDALWDRIGLAREEYERLAAHQHSFAELAAMYFGPPVALGSDGEPVQVRPARGSVSLLPLLGIRVQRGRWFLPGEEGPGAPRVLVIPDAMWRTRLGAREDVIGSTRVRTPLLLLSCAVTVLRCAARPRDGAPRSGGSARAQRAPRARRTDGVLDRSNPDGDARPAGVPLR